MEIFCEKKLIMFAFLTSRVQHLWVVLLPREINYCSGCKNHLSFLQDAPSEILMVCDRQIIHKVFTFLFRLFPLRNHIV